MSASLLVLTALLSGAHAIRIPIRRQSKSSAVRPPGVIVDNNAPPNFGFSVVQDPRSYADGFYTCTVSVQGKQFQVVLDTGSPDLWVKTTGVNLPGVINTGVNQTTVYGSVEDRTYTEGVIALSNITFGPYTVTDQAFINALESNATQPGEMDGILGIGPPYGSGIIPLLENTTYKENSPPFLWNLFENAPKLEPFFTILANRTTVGIEQGGAFTISEVVEEYAAIRQQPQHPVVALENWELYMDGFYVNGRWITGHSAGTNGTDVTSTPGPNQTIVLIDSGTSYIGALPALVDAAYKDVAGAVFNESQGAYQLPCSTKMNISFVFDGLAYPIDPLDAITPLVDDDGAVRCFSSFSYSTGEGDDLILGDLFMHNVYSLFNLGNMTHHWPNPPYIQMLSTVDAEQAWEEFDRLNILRIAKLVEFQTQHDTMSTYSIAASQSETYTLASVSTSATPVSITAVPTYATATPSAACGADIQDLSAVASSPDLDVLQRNEHVIIGLLVGVLVLLFGIVVKLVKDGGKSQYRSVPTVIPPVGGFDDKPYYGATSTEMDTPYDDPARY